MTVRAIPTRWRAVLKPWCTHLKQMEDITQPVSGNSECRSEVRIDLGVASTRKNWRENVRRCRKLLELLAIIVVAESASVDGEFDFTNDKRIKTVDDVEVHREFFFAFDEHSLSDEFHRARDEIHSKLTPEMKQMSALALVKAVTEKANQERARGGNGGSGSIDQRQYQFPYTDLRAGLSVSSFKLERGAVPVLIELLALGVGGLGDIDVGANSALGRLPISELGPILHAVTDGSSFQASEGYEKILRGERRELQLQNWTPNGAWHARQLEAVCSSLAVCKNLQRLHLSRLGRGGGGSPSCESRCKKVLQWLAYALFSKESKASFTTLSVKEADFQETDMVTIIDVLVAAHPVKLLLDEEDPETEDNGDDDDEDKDPGDLQFGTPEENLMTVFTEAYERGKCKIESLNIEDLKIGQVEALVAFIRMLQEPTSAAAKSLRNPPLTPPHLLLDEDVFTAFAEMLHVNRTLEYLDVHMNETLTDGFEAELMSFDKQIIGWRLPSPKRRYAFLSVLQHFAALSQTTEPPPRKCPRPH